MKSKKKLLLMGVGVMGALAMGVGATSTFAWFGANGALGATQSQVNNALTVEHTGTAQISDQVIKFTFENETNVDLIDALTTHKTMYVVDGVVYEGTSLNQVGVWKIKTVEWDTTATGYNIEQIKSQFGGQHISVVVSAAGEQANNIKLVTGESTWTEASSSQLTFQLDCAAADGALTWNTSVNSTYLEYVSGDSGPKRPFGYFCVLANSGHNSTTVGATDAAESASDYDVKLEATLSGSFGS